MRHLIMPIAAVIALSACASGGVMVSEKQASQFERGKTTEADVISALGKPSGVSNFNGQRTLSYVGFHAQARAESFIPIVGAFVGGSDGQTNIAVFRFDNDGKLADYSVNESNSGVSTGLTSGPMQPRSVNDGRRVE